MVVWVRDWPLSRCLCRRLSVFLCVACFVMLAVRMLGVGVRRRLSRRLNPMLVLVLCRFCRSGVRLRVLTLLSLIIVRRRVLSLGLMVG